MSPVYHRYLRLEVEVRRSHSLCFLPQLEGEIGRARRRCEEESYEEEGEGGGPHVP